jgi:hypothetical protein
MRGGKMTIKEHVRGKQRRLAVPGFLAWLGMVVFLLAKPTAIPVWAGIFMPIFFVLFLCQLYLNRCPRCGGNLGQHLMTARGPSLTPCKEVRFCPYCGVGLDEPVVELEGA